MLLTTIRYAITYSFFAMSAFASSFIASLIGRFEHYHPLWSSPGSLVLYVTGIVTLATIAAIIRARSAREAHTTYRYRLAG